MQIHLLGGELACHRHGRLIAVHKPFLATDLEVLTVTPTSAVISWITRAPRHGLVVPRAVPTDTQLWLGDPQGELTLVHDDPTPRAFHQVSVTGLEPGREYSFRARSYGVQPLPGLYTTNRHTSPERVHSFVTLTPPPGRYLTTIALANDMHLGEKRQGIVLGPLPTSVAPGRGQAGYPEMMFTAMLDELRAVHGHPFLVLGGDITYGGTESQVTLAHRLLEGYGTSDNDWLAVRGNHDRPLRSGDDPFGESFVAYQHMCANQTPEGLRILGIDTTRGGGGGWILPPQFDDIRSCLADEPDRPTLVTSHHPVTHDAAFTSPSGPQFMLRWRDRIAIQRVERAAHGVFLHHTGHTHRMRRGKADVQGAHTEYFENAACAAYPGGYTLLHLYEGGYLRNFWRIPTTAAQDWLFRSRWQVMGLMPQLTMGTTNDRNHVVLKDLSGLRATGRPVPRELRV